ncbi:hypothetical protein SAMN04488109_5930 [Chryseolinea serpens]|uniref:Outer membrane protein beta-barrel domain-containing protein n=1 Tax=Chryseolinea serpens TaxID=947013 RepID=A0A1M5WQU5_9BACT|nr:hypothetical protein [Chryseolinea serpens]SHH89976.1 hypothetical protein SAMN04488109_5930 [Chryseolinea serpens]
MKKIFFLLLLTPAVVKAQFSKGDAFLGGNVSGSYYHYAPVENQRNLNYYRNTNYSYSLSPIFGFFTSKRFALGGNIEIGRTSTTNVYGTNLNSVKSQSTDGSVALLGRYFFTFNEKFLFALTGDVFYSKSQTTNKSADGTETTDKSNSSGVHVKPTFLFFPSRRWGFEASIGSIEFVHSKTVRGQSVMGDTKNDDFKATYGAISLGLAYYFRKS